uniref:RUN domain-containing protein n=1 Tax=Rhabditophanes sp. KR3021 TaxID=114890 RepID=A0AC35TNR4_9BILA
METKSALSEAMMVAFSTAASVVPKKTSRNLSDFRDIAHLAVAVNGFVLTPRQRLLITTSYSKWHKKSKILVGDWVHKYLIENTKDLKEILMDDQNKEVVKLYSSTITDIIDMAVESLDYLDDALGPLLVSYTASGGILSGQALFDAHYWKCVCEALCQLVGKELSYSRLIKYDTIYSWRILILFISAKIASGLEIKEGSVGSRSSSNRASLKSALNRKQNSKDIDDASTSALIFPLTATSISPLAGTTTSPLASTTISKKSPI